jgi:hypothetical protein
LVHSGVASGRAEIAHGIEVIPSHLAEQVTQCSTQYLDTATRPLVRLGT